MSIRPSLLALALATTLLHPAFGQTPTVLARVSGYTAIGVGVILDSERVPIAVTRNDGLLHAEASGDGGSFFSTPIGIGLDAFTFTSASAVGFASAEPGVLHIYGSDLAIAQPAIIGPNLPPVNNGNTVYTHIEAGASFTDYLTVDVPGAAIGTPVQVPFNYLAEVVSDTLLGYPQYSAHAITVGASFNITGIGAQNFSTDTNVDFFRTTLLPNGNFLHVIRSDPFTVDAHVGDVLTISAAFGIYGQANITDSAHQYRFGSFADGRNTAGIWLGPLQGGMVVTSASGHDYRIDPTAVAVAAVPEPETYASMLAGLAVVGFIARRRRHSGPVRRTIPRIQDDSALA